MYNEGYGMIPVCADWALVRCEPQQEIDLIGGTFRGERELLGLFDDLLAYWGLYWLDVSTRKPLTLFECDGQH